MKKLVFVSLLGSLAVPAGTVFAQDPEPEEATESRAEAESEEEEEDESWTDNLTYNIFADAFYQRSWNFEDNPADVTAVPHRDYIYTNGFGLAFAGVDASYTGEKFGATVSLRYGIGAERYLIGGALRATGAVSPGTGTPLPTYGGLIPGLSAIKQAYGTIMPTDRLTIDVGLWDTIYGAEVADSWVNLNYTRSPLNYLMQPFYHLGVRASYQISDSLVVKGFVANPVNAYTQMNALPYLGAQVGYTSDNVSLYAGYMTGSPNVGTNRGSWEHFVDLVATLNFGDLTLVGNFDLWYNPNKAADHSLGYGVSVTAGYDITDVVQVAGRVDVIRPSDQYWTNAYDTLIVGTGTLTINPWDDHVFLRLEHRFEWADTDTFIYNNGMRDWWMSTIASVVVRTGN